MAFDTLSKRLSMLSFGRPGVTLPDPDGELDQGDRQHLLGLYSGLLASSVAPPVRGFTVDFAFTRGFTVDFAFTRGFTVDFAFTRGFTVDFN